MRADPAFGLGGRCDAEDRCDGHRRDRTGRYRQGAVLEHDHGWANRDAADQPVRASGYRSQIAAEADFDPARRAWTSTRAAARTATCSSRPPPRSRRPTIAAWTSTRSTTTAWRVAWSSAVGGTMALEDGYVAVSNHGKDWLVDPDYAAPFIYNKGLDPELARERGGAQVRARTDRPTVISTGCTSGIDAIGYGHQMIQDGEADIVISGASESPISPISMACFDPIKATSQRNDDPAHASRPFDRRPRRVRDGRGRRDPDPGGVRGRVRARGAHIYCEVVGYGTRGNAYHMTGLRPEAFAMTEAILDAMRQARSSPRTSTTSTPTGREPSRTTATRRPPTRRPSVSTPTRCRSARSSR